jgi:hypothetical protein
MSMTFSISEQSFDLRSLADGEAPHVVGIQCVSDNVNAALCHMAVSLEDGSYLKLTFNRNGALTGHEVVPAPVAEPATEA